MEYILCKNAERDLVRDLAYEAAVLICASVARDTSQRRKRHVERRIEQT